MLHATVMQGRADLPTRPTRHTWLLVATLLTIDALLVALYLAMHATQGEIAILSVAEERSIPTWYASMKLLVVAQIGVTAAFMTRGPARLALLGLAAMFLLFSIDEIASLHERIGWRLNAWLAAGGPRDELLLHRTGYWMVLLLPPTLAALSFLAVAYGRTGRPAPATMVKALLGAGLFLSGAAGLEALQNFLPDGTIILVAIAIEEGFELAGVTFMLWAALDELQRLGGGSRAFAFNPP